MIVETTIPEQARSAFTVPPGATGDAMRGEPARAMDGREVLR